MAIAALAAVSCTKETKTISVNVSVDESKLTEAGIPSPEAYDVVLTNFATGAAFEGVTENGSTAFGGLVPGTYSATVTGLSSKDGFTYTISGSGSNLNLLNDGDEVVLAVDAVKEAALIFKEIYYTGCHTKDDQTYFRDQFYEIYNNSTETVYADGLCIAETVFANYDFSVFYEWPIEHPEQYIFCDAVWQIPGDGTKYPVKPGESIILAQWGTNHKAENLTGGTSPVDLSGADFEAIEKESTTWNGITITDGPAINMSQVINAAGYQPPQYLLSVSGTTFVIFKPTETLKNEDFITAPNAEYGGTVREIPISCVLDAVQAIGDETRLSTLGMPSILDAGAIWCTGIYVSESISRKVKDTREDGTVVYQDTNNSTQDFVVNKDPQLRRNGAKIPSWNTWIK